MAIDPGAIAYAFHARMKTLTPAWQTKDIGLPFKPENNQPWQRGTLLPGKPDPVAFGSGVYSRMHGIYQIDLFYQKQGNAAKTKPLFERALAMRDHFFPVDRRGLQLTAGSGTIEIEEMPTVSRLIEDDPAWNQLFIEIPFRADDAPPAA